MADERKTPDEFPPTGNEDEEREAEEARAFVLARRARFVAAALASAGIATASCGGETAGTNQQPCLSPAQQAGGMSGYGGASIAEAGTQACLIWVPASGGESGAADAQVCLRVAPAAGGAESGAGGAAGNVDGGREAGTPGSGGMPMPCLTRAR
jgi:hypothetical protein